MNRPRLLRDLSEGFELHDEQSAGHDTASSVPDIVLEYQRKEIEKLSEEIENLKQDRSQRKTFSFWIFMFMCVYMAVSIAIVVLCGLQLMLLSDAVLIAMLTTTLANVIGVFNFVAKYLFHK